ncbi:bifunctional 2-C-methyl-D-erythritol 4-phosphate cytidylyltransferase/2-C-methyl-D-erythritol 2,4-cyclodiphosphate synthase [Sphingomonas aliaeris]|uniref:Bifunctional enzyme IspD/IspF n=1 Tax=Sphingomonas aliaeris TaxID=2759526 RepID=A0A974S2Q8_9SPHN|nr:bifunctional 2-C-methyl-D-erythritol 4-phosphate cytidylyltransferase/2-C-methyl-D-erythritol 2,4-cyclodiphosphate synthase [Sphingomonas aliaeris]QQV75823.1 bifunctional 2-C-methyl-D-erythritol 4-phosphate cytidylyltransferase/2-C-methyl-D-erythritol 2,4-cyclodiphosphate synthase [Sphingomonas aliaeris]
MTSPNQHAGPRIAAIIVAAGSGSRSGSEIPKQFTILAGLPMIAHSYRALRDHPAIGQVVVVIGDDQGAMLAATIPDATGVAGGATRRLSVRAGLEALAADAPRAVLIHDAARPFLSAAVIDRLVAALDTSDGALPALPVADTLARGDTVLGETVDREGLWRVQTPQAFRFETILAAHRDWAFDEPTDDAQMVRRLGGTVAMVEGDTMLEKITYPSDFAAAEARIAPPPLISRSASGFDVHRLEVGEELWLGGILIPHDKGLSGHSDADVALHAITDALLGTIAAGDIGTHFPPSDPQWKGADSAQFLQHAATLVRTEGGVIDFVDLTLMCEAPKIGPHREAMRTRIAGLLELTPRQVSVKATTTERLGFTGRGEGIAAQAVATIRIPA